MSPTRRMGLLVLAVAALAGTAWLLPLSTWPAAVARLGPWAPVVGVLAGAALLVALVPRTPVSIACGLFFGPVFGSVYALLVALIAAAVTFAAGRLLGHDFVARHAGRRYRRIESWITGEGILAVAAFRALPIGPYGLSGYAYGASRVRIRDYALGTFISAAPSAVSYALIGAAVAAPGRFSLVTLVPLGFGLLLSAWLLYRLRRSARARRPVEPPAPAALTGGPA